MNDRPDDPGRNDAGTADAARRPKAASRIEDELLAMLQSGDLMPGEALPSERELMAQFDIGRPAVREALQKLQINGLVEIRHGGRARVAMPTVEHMFSGLSQTVYHVLRHSEGSLGYLLEVREVMEMQMARIAAEVRTPELIGRIADALERQKAAMGSPKEFIERDGAFHLEIARASENPIAVELCNSIFSWLKDFHSQWVRRPGLGALTISEHKAILRAIEEGDVEGAALSMKSHLNRAGSHYSPGNGRPPLRP